MAVSKITFDGHTLIDLTADTVAADKLLSGYTAHDANGNAITGSYTPSAFSVTNRVSEALEADLTTPFNGGLGYKTGYRLGSSGSESAYQDQGVTGFIPVQAGDVIRVLNVGRVSGYNLYIAVYDSSGSFLCNSAQLNMTTSVGGYLAGAVMESGARYIRVSFHKDMAGKVIVTRNEKISPLEE